MLLYEELSNNILQAYFNVFKHLTTGLLESVYENALCIEFDEMGIPYERQKHLSVYYKGKIIGEFIPDIVVDDKIILFEAFGGRNYTCSPKAIYEKMITMKEFQDYKMVLDNMEGQHHIIHMSCFFTLQLCFYITILIN